jgi:hypothetical protein
MITQEFLDYEINRKQRERREVVVTGRRGIYPEDYERTGQEMRRLDAQIDVLRELWQMLETEVPA